MSRDLRDSGIAGLQALDAESGPSAPLSAAESDAIAWSVVSRWSATLPGVEPADAEQGPARPLSADHAARLAQQVVTRIYSERRERSWLEWAGKVAVIALLSLSMAGVSFAAVRTWPSLRERWFGQTPLPTLHEHAPPAAHDVAGVAGAAAPVAAEPPNLERKPPPSAANKVQPRAAAVEDDKPSELLERANALRAQRRWATAERLYVRAIGAGASTQQRYVALVAAAALALQHTQKPERALSLYLRALALVPHGDLSEEARYGVAESHRALGNDVAEVAALRMFVSSYPQSLQTPAARARLTALALESR